MRSSEAQPGGDIMGGRWWGQGGFVFLFFGEVSVVWSLGLL
jgi:hypothetical protein